VPASHFGRTPRYNVRAPTEVMLAILAEVESDVAALDKEIEQP
jgi:hypothetical protein